MIIVRYSEIFLKGKNRIQFERRLIDNIRFALKENNSPGKIIPARNRILITDDSAGYLKELPGVYSLSITEEHPIDIEILKKVAFKIAKENQDKFESFKIDTKRLTKEGEDNTTNSVEIDRLVGEEIYENMHKKVSLKKPDFTIYIEINEGKSYVFTEKLPGMGGLPLGVEGKVFAIIDDEAGLKAAKMMMRRGCIVYPVYSKDNKFKDEVQKLSPGYMIKQVKLKNTSELEELELLARRFETKALVVPDTIKTIKEYKTSLQVFRPLISVLD